MTIRTDGLYRLMAWLSPSYPIGAYSYSHGIEYAVEAGLLRDRASLADWAGHIVARGAGFADAVLAGHAMDAAVAEDWPRLDEIADLAAALRGTAETALESAQQGGSFLSATRAAWPDALLDRFAERRGVSPTPLPVAFGIAASRHAPKPIAIAAYLHAFGANLISAGVRLIPLGQTDGQRALAALLPIVEAAALSGRGNGARRSRHRGARRRLDLDAARNPIYEAVPLMSASPHGPLRVGVGGPVGSGKTALVDRLCKHMRERWNIAVVTNDIYTKEDAEFLTRSGALAAERIVGVETGGCPHTAIREDASINLAAVFDLQARFKDLEIIFVESGGDNLAATFSPELADLTIYVIDVAAGDKIPRKGGPGITRSDLLVINKIDLAPLVGASLDVMDRDAKKMRGTRPFLFTNLKEGKGVAEIAQFVVSKGGLGD